MIYRKQIKEIKPENSQIQKGIYLQIHEVQGTEQTPTIKKINAHIHHKMMNSKDKGNSWKQPKKITLIIQTVIDFPFTNHRGKGK